MEKELAQRARHKPGRPRQRIPKRRRSIRHEIEQRALRLETIDKVQHDTAAEAEGRRIEEILEGIDRIALRTVLGVDAILEIAPDHERFAPEVLVDIRRGEPQGGPDRRVHEFVVVITDNVSDPRPRRRRRGASASNQGPWASWMRLIFFGIAEFARRLKEVESIAKKDNFRDFAPAGGFLEDRLDKSRPPGVHGFENGLEGLAGFAARQAPRPEGEVLERAAVAQVQVADKIQHDK